jgi:hypothetical protein
MRSLLRNIFLLGFLMAHLANAAPVLGNLAQPAVDGSVPITLNQWQASSFRLAENAGAWRVRSITVRMAQQIANDSFSIRVTGETSLRPNLADMRAALTNPPINGTNTQTLTLTTKASPTPILQPGQTYWLVAGVERTDGNVTPSTGLFYWSFANTNIVDAPPMAGWSFGLHTASAGTEGANWAPEATTPFIFSIDAVPEDTTMTLTRWRALHPGGPIATASFLLADSDGNGQSGLLDFATDATPAHLPKPISTGRGVEYTRWTNAPELTLHLEVSSNLTDWTVPTSAEVTTTTSEAGPFTTRVRTTMNASEGNTYFRLRYTLP